MASKRVAPHTTDDHRADVVLHIVRRPSAVQQIARRTERSALLGGDEEVTQHAPTSQAYRRYCVEQQSEHFASVVRRLSVGGPVDCGECEVHVETRTVLLLRLLEEQLAQLERSEDRS